MTNILVIYTPRRKCLRLSIFFLSSHLDLAFDVFRFLASVYLVASLRYLLPQSYYSGDKHKQCRTHTSSNIASSTASASSSMLVTPAPLSLPCTADKLFVPNVDEVFMSIARPIRIDRHSVCKFPVQNTPPLHYQHGWPLRVSLFHQIHLIGGLPRRARKGKEDEG